MFGLSRMRRQRELLFLKAQGLEARAEQSRLHFQQSVLTKMVRPEGLAASFILGLTTQCSVANKQRTALLKMASSEFIGLCKTGLVAFTESKVRSDQGDLHTQDSAPSNLAKENSALSSDGNSMGL